MSRGWHLTKSLAGAAFFALALASCAGEAPPFTEPPPNPDSDPFAPCTDPLKCCPASELKCTGSPDRGVICSCKNLWNCDLNQSKCTQHTPVPPGGGGDWKCTWNEFSYKCKGSGDTSGNPPPGGGGWTCKPDSEKGWECTYDYPPNPANKPDGAGKWICVAGAAQLTCERKEPPPTTTTPPGTTPPPGGGVWKCETNAEGKKVCTKQDDNGGLPPGGGTWRCHEGTEGGKKVKVCVGDLPAGSPPPGGGGWTCKQVANSPDSWICTRPIGTNDVPPGGGYWSCKSGTEFGGTKCSQVDQPPTPPGPYPKPGEKCVPGRKMWCDGLQYCGWGQITCKPDGSWPTRVVNGKSVLDCQELASERRPDNLCGCFHFYFNPVCCESPDCIVPENPPAVPFCTTKQKELEAAGKWGQLCSFCDPRKPACQNGGRCIITNSMETFCGSACSGNSCPTGFSCLPIKVGGGTTNQCVPADFSCYF
ncbi:MAG: hypothetical protein IT371_18135 [Deltaproteobacteria bacterium]|nr:hypothetical protein [Deltaproteobacteria bacterium]